MPIIFGRLHDITSDNVYRLNKWSKDVTFWRDNFVAMSKWVKRYESVGASVLNIPNLSRPSAPDTITANGDVVDTSLSVETSVTLNLDTRVGYKLNLPDDLDLQSAYDLASEYKKSYGMRLGESVESNLLGLQSGLSQTVGDPVADISLPIILQAWKFLSKANAPMEDRHLMIIPGQYEVLLDTDKITKVDSVAYPVNESPIVKGEIGQIFGFRCASSNLIAAATEGGFGNIAFQREAFVLGILRDVKVEEFARTQFSRSIGLSMYYGYTELRDNHGVRILSRDR